MRLMDRRWHLLQHAINPFGESVGPLLLQIRLLRPTLRQFLPIRRACCITTRFNRFIFRKIRLRFLRLSVAADFESSPSPTD